MRGGKNNARKIKIKGNTESRTKTRND
jgi:hypothetical protein